MNGKIEEVEKSVLDFMTPYLTDRSGRIYTQNKEYQKRVKEADSIFEKLNTSLNQEQSKLLEDYLTFNNAAIAIMEKLIYKQGMHDMLDFLLSVIKG